MITLAIKHIKTSLLSASVFGVAALLSSYPTHANTTPDLSETYIALQANSQLKSDFFQVMIAADSENTPYLNIQNTLKQLQAEISCTDNQCKLILQPNNQTYTINAQRQVYTIKGKSYPLPKGVLVQKNNALWLKYSFWQTWLPIRMEWSLENYKVIMQPQFQQLDEIKRKHKLDLEAAKKDNQKRAKLAAAKTKWPTPPWNIEFLTQLSLTQTTDGEFTTTPSIYTNVDIFKGTFNGSLSTVYNNDSGWDNPDYSWSYQRQDQQGNNLFEQSCR